MIRLECYIEDRHVAAVMYAVAGLVKEPAWLPVVNVEARPNGKLASITSGTHTEMFAQYLKDHPGDRITAREAREFVVSVGGSPKTTNTLLTRMTKSGLLRKVPGLRQGYLIVGGKSDTKLLTDGGGSQLDRLRRHLAGRAGQSFTTREAKDFVASIGGSRQSGGPLATRARKEGFLKSARGHGAYTITEKVNA